MHYHMVFLVTLTLFSSPSWAVDSAGSESVVKKGLKFLGGNQASDNILPATHEPEILKDAELKPQLGEKLPLDAQLTDHTGKAVKLGDYFKGEMPTILTMGYYKLSLIHI